ncbi:hypothetical protein [Georgenia daeguensis]|uniref:Uncharacterized protein n=1 Tax=Georgenia daeguensis TaxID=908355 RepID=A0ABP8EZC6_9MICO
MPLEQGPYDEVAYTLTPDQYGQPVKKADLPVPALAWVRHGDGRHHLVDAVATAWTPRAVQVQYTADDDVSALSVWVWANAVIRRWDNHE